MTATPTLVCPVLVGRDDLLDLADRRLREVGEGRGRLLLFAGEAGIGKTRLLGAVERRAAAAGFAVVRAGTYPSDLHVGAALLLDLARSMARTAAFAASGAALAARLEAEVTVGAAAADAQVRRRVLVLDVAEILADAAAGGPALIALEDLHWSDDLTLEMLEALARRVPDLPLLVIATYRSDELYPRIPMREWRARLLTRREAEEVRLDRLSAADTATMATLVLATGLPVAQDVAAAVHTRTDGIPLHVEELVAALSATSPGLAEGNGAAAVRGTQVPDTVEELLVARLEPRTDDARRIARAGAVIGRAFDLDLLASVVDVAPDALSQPLAELADHFVLLPARTPGRYGFRHALICDAIYDRIPEPERRRLHARTADAAIETEYGTDAFLALHYERSGRRAEAHASALRGAAAAAALSSHREARELYGCALRTAPDDLPAPSRARLLEALGASAAATDDNAAASEAYAAAREAHLAAGDRLAAAAVVGPLVAARHLLGDDLDARAAMLRRALGEIDAPPALHGASLDPAADRVRGRLLAALASGYMLDRRLDESIGFAAEARRLAALSDDRETEQHAAATLGACYVFAGRMDEGWTVLESAIAGAAADGHEAETARGHRMLGTSASVLVEYDRAERWLETGIEHAERVELWNHRHYMAAHLGHVLWATGAWDRAEEIARQALADGRGGITTRVVALHVLGYVALGRGRLVEAVSHLGEAATIGRRMAELQRLSPALWGLAEAALARNDPHAARAFCDEALAASSVVDDAAYLFPFTVTGTRASLALNDPGGARAWVDDIAARLRRRAIPGTLHAIAHADGLVSLAEGSTGQARTLLADAVAGWTARRRVWEGAWARVDLARAHLRSRQTSDAARLAAAVSQDATRLGAPAIVAAAGDVLRGSRRGDPDEPWAPLSAREFEVARLVADGGTNSAIATELGLSPKTVAAHVEHILAKLAVSRRAEIAAWTAERRVLHSAPHGRDREE